MVSFSTVAVLSPAGADPDSALRRAGVFVPAEGRVLLVDVLPELSGLARAVLPDRLEAHYVRERDEQLREAAARTRLDVDVEVRVLVGHPAVSIVRMVVYERVDLLMKVACSTQAARLDAFDLGLLRKSPCPVWIHHDDPAMADRRILAAIDPMASAAGDTGLSQSILDHAVSIGDREDAEVHVVHAWSVCGELRSGVPSEEVRQYVAQGRRTSADALARVLQPFGPRIDPSRVHVVNGAASEVIVRLATTLPADLVVMGTVARRGLPGLLMGNTAENVLPRLGRDVLVIKPEGFVCPFSPANERSGARAESAQPTSEVPN